VRWRKPDGTIVSPADFIPVAEDTGVIVALGTWIMQEACRQMRAWCDEHPGGLFGALTVAVNVSARQLADADALLGVGSTMALGGAPPAGIGFEGEITEGVMMEPGAATGILTRLRGAGVALHMDDFGTGYSSLSRLHCFPIQGLKIDPAPSSTRRPAGKRRSRCCSRSSPCRTTWGSRSSPKASRLADQVALLQTLECDFAQGYHFSQAPPADEVAAFIQSPRPWGAATAA